MKASKQSAILSCATILFFSFSFFFVTISLLCFSPHQWSCIMREPSPSASMMELAEVDCVIFSAFAEFEYNHA